ncbi:MAG: hypothetical protein WDA16_05265 [Candidatus Thermoplasmatota archaeon]
MIESTALTQRRELVFEMIVARSGIHTRLLARECGIALSTAKYHIDLLERTGRITFRQDGRYRRLFPVGAPDAIMIVRSALQRRVPATVLAVVARRKTSTRRDISNATGISGSTLGGALVYLHRLGVLTRELQGGRFVYRVTDPALVLPLVAETERGLTVATPVATPPASSITTA